MTAIPIRALDGPTDAYLMHFAFATRPLFRIGYDMHVRAWRSHMQEVLWHRYWSNREFREAYDTRVEARRRQPMPAWPVRSVAA